ncbi:MAG: type II secretion system minor pseudopilin GspK [Wenzhouxiangella sp.]|nr:type II secretion system minor pseudopilin GspK [Wenzhouxiangella sp.]
MKSALHQRGAALLVALLAVALATVLAVGLIERGQGTLARTQALIASERSYQYAMGMNLLADRLIERVMTENLDPSLLDGTWTPLYEVPGGLIQGRLLDQNARFNVNALAHPDRARAGLAQERFERLLDQLGLSPIIAAELADWLEGASLPRPGSVGDSYYAGQRPPYRMAGTLLAHPSEMRWLRSVDESAWQRLASLVTALPEPELIVNVNTADATILASLLPDLDMDSARRLADDGPWTDVRSFLQHPLVQLHAVPGLELHLTVLSPWYLAQARVVLDDVERDYFQLMRWGTSGYDFRLFSQCVP